MEKTEIKIKKLNEKAMEEAAKRQEKLAKPPGSLGRLEEISIRLAGMRGSPISRIEKPCIIIMCADNGVIAEGVASAPLSVTMAQTINFTMKKTGVGALAKEFGTDLMVIDVGINGMVPEELKTMDYPGPGKQVKIIDRKIAMGTNNINEGPAMTMSQTQRAIEIGIEAAVKAADAGHDIIGVGEMGIGNTTTGSAFLSALTGLSPGETTGRGGGINDLTFAHKKEIVAKASARASKNRDIKNLLAETAGFDIAAMTGAFIGAASKGIPAVIDGYISAVAALAAQRMEPEAGNYFFASHRSAEAAYDHVIKELGTKPLLDLEMRLGEGSGCVPAFEIIRSACAVIGNMATFEEARIDDGYLEEIRKGGCF